MNTTVVLILVQLITESLPVSSSSHVRIFGVLMERCGLAVEPWSLYVDHLLHGPMLVVLALFFWRAWTQPLWLWVNGLLGRKKFAASWRRLNFTLLCMVLLQSLVLGIVSSFYFVFLPVLKTTVWFHHPALLVGGLVLTMTLLLSLRWLTKPAAWNTFGVRQAIVLGFVQIMALFPGISRFASSYVAARWLGIAPRRAFQITFAVEVPMLLGALLVNGLPVLLKGNAFGQLTPLTVAMTFFVGSIVSLGALYGAWKMATDNIFWLFGVYMIVPIATVIALLVY